jgi:hypothetical protein
MTLTQTCEQSPQVRQEQLECACKCARYLRDLRERAGLRAEKVLAEFYKPRHQVRIEGDTIFQIKNSRDDLSRKVLEFHNGHPVTLDDLVVKFPEESRSRLATAQKNLVFSRRLKRIGIGTTLKPFAALLLAFVVAGCASKPIPTSERPMQRTVNAITPPMPTTTVASGRSVVSPLPRTNITLAWTNPNPPSDAKYMLTEFWSKTDLTQPFTFKCYVPAGLASVVFPKTNAAEFFACRFAQTNVTPWLLSDWNTK